MSSCKDGETIDLIEIDTPTPEYLPMSVLNLEDLSAFNNAESNCIIVSEVLSDFNKEGDLVTKEGKGILVNHGQSEDQPTTSLKENTIYTNMEHGDILIEFDVLIPKGSISNLLFMSRYGLQVTDNNKSTSSDLVCGGILKPKTGEADDLVALPIVNAARAPGLWQNLKVQFRAPKFNQSGEKEGSECKVRVCLS